MNRLSINALLFLMILCINICTAQNYRQQLCNIFSTGSEPTPTGLGSFSFQQSYTASSSLWTLNWNENLVFNNLMSYTSPTNPNESFEMRMGKGGQIYSFKSAGFGEALPPQWRPSYNSSGQNIVYPGASNPINSHHGNWAPWVDEVWQLVGSDQKDLLDNSVVTQNIHQAGSYMNNFSHRASDLTLSPYYSPMVQSHYDATNQSFTSIIWGQSESPNFVYNPRANCNTCFGSNFSPSILYFQRHKNIGNGVIQVDFLIYNFHREREIDYWSVPFLGIRNSSLPYAFVSNSTTNGSSYAVLNTQPGHPNPANPNDYLPPYSEGASVITSGNNAQSSGWFALSTTLQGNGPTLAFVTAKSSSNPSNAYGDIRYGTAMTNSIRDVTIFARRAIGGAVNAQTGLKPWGIVDGQSIKGRYFIVLGSNLSSVVQTIQNRSLITHSSIEKVTISQNLSNIIHYNFTSNPSGTYSVQQTTSPNPYISLNSQPFKDSYPVFMISSSSASYISSNPYALSLKPYDGTMQNIELLGFSSSFQNLQNLNTIVPVTLTYFKGTKIKNTSALLEWGTSSEINNDYFKIEHSADGINYRKIGTIKGKGNTSISQGYDFTDSNPVTGNNYYRIGQVDFDGRTNEYSKTIVLSFEKEVSMAVFPNPFSDKFYIDIYADRSENTTIKLFDMTGRLVYELHQNLQYGNNHITILGEELVAGFYKVLVVTNKKTMTMTLVKK